MRIAGQSGRSIPPGASDEIEVTLSTGNRAGEFDRRISVQTNDPDHPQVSLTCRARAMVPFNTEPASVNFGRIPRDAGPQTKTVAITRGDGGPLVPELLPSRDPTVTANLREVERGERYELDITVSPPWGNDRLASALTLKTGLPEASTGTIRVFGQVDPRLRAEPRNFVLPAQVAQETEVLVRLRWSGEPGKVLNATVGDPELSVRVEEQEDGEQVVVLTAPAGYRRQPGRGAFVALSTDDEAVSMLRIPIQIGSPRPPRGAGPTSSATEAGVPATEPGEPARPVLLRMEEVPATPTTAEPAR